MYVCEEGLSRGHALVTKPRGVISPLAANDAATREWVTSMLFLKNESTSVLASRFILLQTNVPLHAGLKNCRDEMPKLHPSVSGFKERPKRAHFFLPCGSQSVERASWAT